MVVVGWGAGGGLFVWFWGGLGGGVREWIVGNGRKIKEKKSNKFK